MTMPIMSKRTVSLVSLVALLAAACGSSSPIKSIYADGGGGDDGALGKGDGAGGHRGDGSGGTRKDTGTILTGGDSSTTTDASCGTVKQKAQPLPVEILFGIDTSFSMDFESKWTNLSAALTSFVNDPASAGLDLGIQFFPLRETCDVAGYEALAVPVGPQSTVGPLISQAIAAKMMAGGTPTVQILEGLVAYLQANPPMAGVKPIIVLATDGIPDSTCLAVPDGGTTNSLANAEAVAAAAFGGPSAIPTFVIGVGSDLTALNGLAAAGGTGTATLVSVGSDAGNPEQAFVNALNAIRQQALPCEFAIPSGTMLTPSQTNVDYTPGTGATQSLVYVASSAGCSMAPTNGWYFDNPANPTQVVLCSGACNVVKGDPNGEVSVVLGCPTKVP
jgi:hypothetical protein